MQKKLHNYFDAAYESNGEKIFLKTSSAQFSFSQIRNLAENFRSVLFSNGFQDKDRIVIYSSKNAASIAMMIASSQSDGIYVPVSSLNPVPRAKLIMEETTARFVLCDDSTLGELKKTTEDFKLILSENQTHLLQFSWPDNYLVKNDDNAFILFTSGSTGTPKGVMISHTAAISFIDWAAEEFQINSGSRLASIAPFNFDLSVFDIYVSAKKSATLVLYSEEETKNALLMAQKISVDAITTIYATPTFYSTLAHYGKLHKYDFSALENVLFAGEVFLLENFNELLLHWPGKKFANLYGPTETNVCSYFRINTDKINYPEFPIGKSCPYADMLLIDDNGNEIKLKNTKGELFVAGPSLFTGYWRDEEKTKASEFFAKDNKRYYKTGDIAYLNDEGDYVYVMRKDRMIKRHGFRIEPMEIERVLIKYKSVSGAVIIYSKTSKQLVAFIESDSLNETNFFDLKQFCLNYLPQYMVPDKFIAMKKLPQTTSGKTDLHFLENNYEF